MLFVVNCWFEFWFPMLPMLYTDYKSTMFRANLENIIYFGQTTKQLELLSYLCTIYEYNLITGDTQKSVFSSWINLSFIHFKKRRLKLFPLCSMSVGESGVGCVT